MHYKDSAVLHQASAECLPFHEHFTEPDVSAPQSLKLQLHQEHRRRDCTGASSTCEGSSCKFPIFFFCSRANIDSSITQLGMLGFGDSSITQLGMLDVHDAASAVTRSVLALGQTARMMAEGGCQLSAFSFPGTPPPPPKPRNPGHGHFPGSVASSQDGPDFRVPHCELTQPVVVLGADRSESVIEEAELAVRI